MTNAFIKSAPGGLTSRARYFVETQGIRLDVRPAEDNCEWWREHGVPTEVIDRMAAYQDTWGGVALPPAPEYDGGPRYFDADSPEADETGWWFEAGTQRTAVPYSFLIGPDGAFGIQVEAHRWAPLHASVEGWVEAVALAHHASAHATRITRFAGDEVEGVELGDCEPVREVQGLADTWWRGPDRLVAVHRGEADALDFPRGRVVRVYSGLDDWGLYGGVRPDAH
ncbi:hypothetical protein [Streptomyces evansiae]|uniref:hypothetical protein n=1 Tax=Streptomyces evansiae TaxID=3075535 RepID=UPI0028857B01|nr:hypothetical protein [Streptomyces sp. DSM 41859]MDT0422474.1 hypothetical protein [Streptomyces sp. DSM 41859]